MCGITDMHKKRIITQGRQQQQNTSLKVIQYHKADTVCISIQLGGAMVMQLPFKQIQTMQTLPAAIPTEVNFNIVI